MIELMNKFNLWISSRKLRRLGRKDYINKIIKISSHVEFDGKIYPIKKNICGGFSFCVNGKVYETMNPASDNLNHRHGNRFDMMVENFCDDYADDISIRLFNLTPSNLAISVPESELLSRRYSTDS